MGDVGTIDLVCITLAREVGYHGGRLKQRAKDYNRNFTSSTNGEQAIYSPTHSPSLPPQPQNNNINKS
jgi:hypothetical protein